MDTYDGHLWTKIILSRSALHEEETMGRDQEVINVDGDLLKGLRKQLLPRRQDLVDRVKVSYKTIQRMENEGIATPETLHLTLDVLHECATKKNKPECIQVIGLLRAKYSLVNKSLIQSDQINCSALLHSGFHPLPADINQRSPSHLLRAGSSALPCWEREAELSDLEGWCKDEEKRVSVRLYTGPGGCGKTRLMIEAVKNQSKQGWIAGFLKKKLPEQAVRVLTNGPGDRLIVIDLSLIHISEPTRPY